MKSLMTAIAVLMAAQTVFAGYYNPFENVEVGVCPGIQTDSKNQIAIVSIQTKDNY